MSKRSVVLSLVCGLVLIASAGLAACGGTANGSSSTGDASAREAAETKLRQIDSTLDQVLTAYQSGNTAEAIRLANQITTLYEGPTETAVTSADASIERQLDPLLQATLPQQVKSNASAADVQQSVSRAKTLTEQALAKVGAAG